MKFISLAAAALLGFVSVHAINVGESMSIGANKVHKSQSGKQMVSVGLTQTKYDNNRYKEYIQPISKESNLALAQALNIPYVTGKDGHVSLVEQRRHVVDVSMINLENMGYEGTFSFGNPP